MKPSINAINLIKKFEGCRLTAYPDPGTGGDPWTIGWGNTFYKDGTKVKKGDKITQAQADELLQVTVDRFSEKVEGLLRLAISQNQFDALVDFSYNVGVANLSISTLLKKVNKNPNDPTIEIEFLRWVKAGGKLLQGLVRRRKAEVKLYFTK